MLLINHIILIICSSLLDINASIIYTYFQLDNNSLDLINQFKPSNPQITRIELNPNNTFINSLFKNTQNTSQVDRFAFESYEKYYSSIQINDLITIIQPNLSFIVTHTSFDCDDNFPTNTSSNTNTPKTICLLPSVNKIYLALSTFLNEYKFIYYAIVYSPIELYERLASSLSSKLSLDSFILDFAIDSTSQLITDKIQNAKANIVFLLFECGSEDAFIQTYSNISSNLIFVSVYNTPECSVFINSNETFNNRLLKLIPIDINESNYATIINPNGINSTSNSHLFRSLIEIQTYHFLNDYNYTLTSIDLLNSTTFISLDCQYVSIYNPYIPTRYCQRLFNFYLYQYDPVNLSYKDTILFIFNDTTNQFSLNKTNNLQWPSIVTFSENSSTTTCSSLEELNFYRTIFYVFIGIGCIAFLSFIVVYSVRNHFAKKQLAAGPNKMFLLPDDIQYLSNKSRTQFSEKSTQSLKSDTDNITSKMAAKFKDEIVFVKLINIPHFQLNGRTMRDLKTMRELRHENLNGFIGYLDDPRSPSIVFEYASRGSLSDILAKQEIKLDWNFKWSMMNDLCRAMKYLHHSAVKYHGNLKSKNCVVDSKWVLKITDFGLPGIYHSQNYKRTVELGDLLWTAPEHLRTCIIKDTAILSDGSQPGDVYSFSIIMQEIILRGPPFFNMDLTPAEIIRKLSKPPPLLRPSVSKQAAPPEYINIMKQCWIEQPDVRPTFDTLHQQFKHLNGGKKVNIVDIMFKQLEQYSNNLEDSIRERTLELEEEKKKTVNLLVQMLPRSVAESLLKNKPVAPEAYECVTIYFSDIVGFTTISAFSSPIEVVNLLNDLYTMFDSILTDFDCYKVETIGDAYMVVSGLPSRNGNKHAGEIATMALNLLHHCGKFQIRHLPGIPLRLRIGIHSGGCVSGVVGLKMPRYCLFGDTVNTASRMESSSMAFRIHVSEAAANILNEIGGYHLEFRGVTELKGKGKHKTFWLTGKDGFDKELPDPVVSENNHGIDDELIESIKRIREVNRLNQLREEQEKQQEQVETIQPQELIQIKKMDKHDSGFSEQTTNSSSENTIASNTKINSVSQTNLIEIVEKEINKKRLRKPRKISALTDIDSFT